MNHIKKIRRENVQLAGHTGYPTRMKKTKATQMVKRHFPQQFLPHPLYLKNIFFILYIILFEIIFPLELCLILTVPTVTPFMVKILFLCMSLFY